MKQAKELAQTALTQAERAVEYASGASRYVCTLLVQEMHAQHTVKPVPIMLVTSERVGLPAVSAQHCGNGTSDNSRDAGGSHGRRGAAVHVFRWKRRGEADTT